MKGYVVTLVNMHKSIEIARRCIESAKKFGVAAENFPAVPKEIARQEAAREGLVIGLWDESYSNTDAVIGNFVAQYRAWGKILREGEPAIVLEHDAVFVGMIPDLCGCGDIINLGKPSYGRFNTQKQPGVYPMFSKPPVEPWGTYIPGAHGYYLTPNGAKRLIERAHEIGVYPCDLFLNTKNFPDIQELYPWLVEAHDSFSTIQKPSGCKAKHNFSSDYQLL